MRRYFTTARWGLAGLLLLSGCSEAQRPPTPKTVARTANRGTTRPAEPRLLPNLRVQTANHNSLLPLPEGLSAEDLAAAPQVRPSASDPAFSRLPPPRDLATSGRRAKIWQLGSNRAVPVDLTQPDWSARASCVPRVALSRMEDRLPDTYPVTGPPPYDEPTYREGTPHRGLPLVHEVQASPTKPALPSLDNAYPRDTRLSSAWASVGPALNAVAERAGNTIEHGFEMAEKGAVYSAKAEFKQALRVISQSLDAQYGGQEFSTALATGWLALEEADDFAAHGNQGPVVNVELIVGLHQTPILKPYELRSVSPVLAMQHYYIFAEEQLLAACGQAPVASRAMFGLGKLHMVLGETSPSAERLHGPKAMAFHQVALLIDSTNYLAANELGVLLARCGKLPEARYVLQQSMALHPLPETWRNLSVVHQRLGETALAAQSHANWQYASQQSANLSVVPPTSADGSMVQWVTPQVFAYEGSGGAPMAASPQPMTIPRQAVAPAKKSGILWW